MAAKRARIGGSGFIMGEEEAEMREADAIRMVNTAIAGLETSLARWDASDKTPGLMAEFERYRRLYDSLLRWQRKAVKSMGRKGGHEERLARLRELSDICGGRASGTG